MLLMLARVSWAMRPRIDCRWAMVSLFREVMTV
jgi:hypothetical protein